MRTILAAGLWTVMAAGCGGNVVTPGAGGAGGHGTSTTTTGAGGSGAGGSCATPCSGGLVCCGAACVNTHNDILNCGICGKICQGTNPFCDDGTCAPPPCAVQCGGACCGAECCVLGQLCCVVPGPITSGPTCTQPVNGTCPAGCPECKCASPDTPIATPDGDRPIAELAAGDRVYSVDHDAVVAVPLLRVHRTPVRDHHVVRVTLASGAVLEVSPRHPTADGRTFGDLRAGDTLDRLAVTRVEIIPYAHPFTYDILPASETHTYFAGGALIGTTLPP